MSQVSFPISTFTDAEGNPLSNGYLLIRINTDAMSPSGQICYQLQVRIPLDVNGEVSGSYLFWPNVSLNPLGSYYVLRAYAADGQLVLGPLTVIIGGGAFGFGEAFGSYFGS